jgi:hypothetical protein
MSEAFLRIFCQTKSLIFWHILFVIFWRGFFCPTLNLIFFTVVFFGQNPSDGPSEPAAQVFINIADGTTFTCVDDDHHVTNSSSSKLPVHNNAEEEEEEEEEEEMEGRNGLERGEIPRAELLNRDVSNQFSPFIPFCV